MEGPIRVVCAANDAYAKHLAVMLTSLLRNRKSATPIAISVIDGGGLSPKNKARLRRAVKPYGAPLDFLRFDNAKLKGVTRAKVYKRYGKEAFYRIFIPELFGRHVKKAIYLDSDMIVKGDIARLWRVPLGGAFVAAADDPSAAKMSRKLGLPPGRYFNSGVLVIDVERWRRHRIATKVIRYILRHAKDIRFPDQDGLNAVLHGKTKRLPIEWNCPAFRSHLHPKLRILHFMTPKKPWNRNPRGKRLYLQYAAKTVWTDGAAEGAEF